MTSGEHRHDVALATTTERRLRAAVVANVGVVVAQVAAGVAAGSLALLADAWHNLADVVAVTLALGAHRLARRAPTVDRSFGWHRSRVLAAQANAAGILVVTGVLLVASVDRLLRPRPVEGGLVLAAALLGALVNGGAAWALRGERDLGARSAFVHLAGDAAASVAVAVAGAVMLATGGWNRLDPAASTVVAALVLVTGWRLLRRTTDVLLEGTPRDVDPTLVTRTIERVPGVASAHDLHVWSLDGQRHALSVHVVVSGSPSLVEAQVVGSAVKQAVAAPFGIAHATVELESQWCAEDGGACVFDVREAPG